MFYVSLVHATFFIFLGVITAVQARSILNFLPGKTTYLLSAFALSRGLLKVLEISHGVGAPGAERFGVFATIFAAPSFLLLLVFGTELTAHLANRPPRLKGRIRLIPIPAAVIWFILLRLGIFHDADPLLATEATARYALALPGACFASLGLYLGSRTQAPDLRRLRAHLLAGAAAFALYGILAGIVAPISLFGEPLTLLEASVRALCTVAVVGVFSHALLVQVAQIRRLAEESRDRHLAMIAHDLKNPLAAIQLNAQLLARALPPNTPLRHSEMLDRLLHSVKHMQRLLSDLFDSTLLQQNHLALRKSRTEMVILLEETIHRACQDRQVILDLPRTPIFSVVDPDRIEQVLGNLVSNACKYSTPGSTIQVRARPHDDALEISIANEGTGIPAEEQELIFTRFYRCKAVQSTGKKGTGLGLYITKALVEAHGGRVTLTSEPGKRTTFSVWLPTAS